MTQDMPPGTRTPLGDPVRPATRRRNWIWLYLALGGALLAAYLSWPYVTLWRLDAAVRSAGSQRLEDFVDLDAVRTELKRKLNKDMASTIDDLSDPFIRWLDAGIQAMGREVIDRLVTLDWIRERLLAHSPPAQSAGFLSQISQARFEAADGFHLHIGPANADPVKVRMRLEGFSWRIAAVSY